MLYRPVVLLCLVGLAASCGPPPAPPAAPPAAPAASVDGWTIPSDAAIEALLAERHRGVGVVVGVIEPAGRRVIAHGRSGASDGRPLDGDTIFQIGSITKPFTALILADMIQRGEVGLDDPAGRYLPPGVVMPVVGRPITLFDLATHRSGLPSMPDFALDAEPDPYAGYTADQLHRFLSRTSPLRPPGGPRGHYSNLGVALLGRLLAQRAGTDYESLLRDRVLAPLGMTSTAVTLTPAQRRRLAPGHDRDLRPVDTWNLVVLPGSGGLRSTANDLLRFLAAALDHERTPLAAAMRYQWTTRQPPGGQALGWGVAKIKATGEEIVRHEGGKEGYRAAVAFSPGRRSGVVVLSNARTDESPMDIAMHLLTGRALKPAPPAAAPRTRIALDRPALDACAGRYRLADMTLEIARRGDMLLVRPEGGGVSTFFADGPRSFFDNTSDERIRFEADAGGRIVGLVLRSGGTDSPGERVSP